MKKSRLLSALSAGICSAIFCSTASAALLPRLETAPGSGVFLAYYNDVLDITWATDANINGLATWSAQQSWVSSLTLGGVSGWRLPSADVNGDGTIVDCSGGGVTGCEDNEMGFLYWEEGISAAAPSQFSKVQFNYWSGTDIPGSPSFASIFNFGPGTVSFAGKEGNTLSAWAVIDGDVPAVVPVPAAMWLFGSGLLGLVGVARRKKV